MGRIISEIFVWVALVLCLATNVRAKHAPLKVLFPGNWADPTVVKVGEHCYLTSNHA